MEIPTVTPTELDLELKSDKPPMLLDVREAHELKISALPNIVHIPLGDLESRLSELKKNENWVVICRTGNRSGTATELMLQNGFSSVRNMVKGMNGWAMSVDESMEMY